MLDEAALKAAIEKARKNITDMGGKTAGDLLLVEHAAALLVRVLPHVVDEAIKFAAARDIAFFRMVGGDPAKFRAEDFYSPNSTAWLWKQTLYLALEVVKELPHEVTGS